MAQPPLPPRTAPLQDDEIVLARVLRALPGEGPSGRVDAAILAAATDAVAGEGAPATPSRRGPRGLRWLPTWAVGTAAAAVLAVGVGSQLRPPLAPERRVPAQAETAAPIPAPAPRVPIELVDPTPPRDSPPTFPPPEAPRTVARPSGPPPPPPPPPPAPVLAEPFPVPAPAAAAPAAPALEDAAEAFAPPPSTIAEADSAGLAMRKAGALPPVAADATLPPEAWLERIRERVRAGDRTGARESLARFRRAHPRVPVPDDLALLRP